MNDEIKEILDYLKEFIDEDRLEQINLNRWFISSLLDYITNLQEQLHQASLDIQELTERDIECPSWCDKLTNLQQENERLKETNVYCNRTDCVGRIKDSKKYDSVYQEKEDYKSRIEKAVEYIENNYLYEDEWVYNEKENKGYETTTDEKTSNDLLNILNGDNNE